MITFDKLDELERLAKAAMPGPWAVCTDPPNNHWYSGRTIGRAVPQGARIADVDFYSCLYQENAAYIAAVDPTTMLELIQQLRDLRNAQTPATC